MHTGFPPPEARRPLGQDLHIDASVGNHRRPHLRQLGLVHAIGQAAHLHAIHPQV